MIKLSDSFKSIAGMIKLEKEDKFVTIAIPLIKEFEQCKLKAYQDSAGVWTCGWGSILGVTPKTEWTQAQADKRFQDDLKSKIADVIALASRSVYNDNQLAALLSFTFNLGRGTLGTLLRNRQPSDVAVMIKAYHKAGGQPVRGLKIRRAVEQELFNLPEGSSFDPKASRSHHTKEIV